MIRRLLWRSMLVVLKKTSGDSVFYCHDSEEGGVGRECVKHDREGLALDSLYLLAVEIEMGGCVVVASGYALYGDFLHRFGRCLN